MKLFWGEATVFDLVRLIFQKVVVIYAIFSREWGIVYLINDSTNKMVNLTI